MIVICVDDGMCSYIVNGGKYKVVAQGENTYAIKIDGIEVWYNKTRFKKVEEVMKIKKWTELNDKKINGHVFCVGDKSIGIYQEKANSNIEMTLSIIALSTDQIIAHLALFGIDIEFEKEVTITQNEFNILNLYKPNIKLKRTLENSEIFTINEDGGWYYIKNSEKLFPFLEIDKEYLIGDILKMKVED